MSSPKIVREAAQRDALERQIALLRKQAIEKEQPRTTKAAKQHHQPKLDRSVHQQQDPTLKKRPPPLVQNGSIVDLPMELCREAEDKEGAWSWGCDRQCIVDRWEDLLGPYVSQYVGRKWKDIEAERSKKGPRHHDYASKDIGKEAYERLVALQLDDLTRIYRFRMEGDDRLYGFRIQATFNTLWYDPHHKIYPTQIQDRGKVRKLQAREESRKGR